MNLFSKTALVLGTVFLLIRCSSPTNSNNNNVTDHTINKSGISHKSGLNDPLTNCIECHGSDLQGGSADVSCYQCHGKKW